MGGSAPREHQVPAESTRFVDRRAELASGRSLLAVSRLVTLTGPGGVGKTRLALRLADRVRRTFPDGVRFMHLSGLDDPELVPLAAADALGLHDHSARPPLTALAEHVRDRRLLLVVDNCEHLLTACAELAAALLHGTQGVRVLATSRHRLGLTEEHLLELRPLPVPDPDGDLSGADRHPALALFADRAAAVVPGFRLTPANRAAVARLCRRLDGLPLALELAAGRLRDLTLDQLLTALDDRYRPLTDAPPTTHPRHQTLRAAVDWSHELCTPQERLVWARASVLAGGFDLETAEAVCGEGGELPEAAHVVGPGRDRLHPGEVLDALAGLVDKSVLGREAGPGGSVRYRLLDTLRQYGLERLRAMPGEEVAVRRRQRDWMQGRAAACERAWFGPGQREIVARLRADQDNLRAALDFSLGTPGEQPAGLRLAGTLWFYWHACGAPREGCHWLARALAANPEPTPERARALWVAGLLAAGTQDFGEGRRLAEQGRALARDLGEEAEAAHADYVVGVITLFSDDLPAALAHFEAAAARGPVPGQHLSLVGLDRVELACALNFLGEADRAMAVCEDARRLCARHGEEWVHSYLLRMLALACAVKRDWPQAERHARQALRLKSAVHDVIGIALTLDLLAQVTTERGAPERAAVLLGGADRVWADIDRNRWGSATLRATRQDSERRAREALGGPAYQRAYRRGHGLDLDRLLDHALDTDEPHRRAPVPARLTPRESQVAELLAQGLANQQIADRLVIARRTAEGHVERILGKLGLSNRSQVAAWMTTRR
ncbi:LuxR C-terminal-related transcriptional regulator [Streptomyces sp. NPDC050803]|uniref:ATP-binding protein n=1 Tax=unclassified Streptomyces TaxID=2593676 RepID=UPI003427A64A